MHREVSDQAKIIAELRNEMQQRMNEAAEAKEQLAQRDAELEETRVQLSQQSGARTVGTPQDELATLLRIPNVKAVSLTGSDMAKRAAGFLLYDSRTHKVWLYSVNLPECPAGTTYQLWAIYDKPLHRDLSDGSRRHRSPPGQEGAELHGCEDLCRQPGTRRRPPATNRTDVSLEPVLARFVWLIWSVWSVLFIWLIWFIWLVSFNQKIRWTRQTK